MKIALLNVKYSPNLGDGLLSECLEAELTSALPGAEVFSIDLAGRRAYPDLGPSRRAHAIWVLEALPLWLRRMVTRTALGALVALRLRGHFNEQLAGCRAAVLGGGNLLTDADLNFPMKLAGALDEVRRRDLPMAVYGVGANRDWSDAGRRLFGEALRSVRLTFASVRDRRSQRAWEELLEPQGVPAARLAGDPGVLACRHFVADAPAAEGPLAGLCITAPMALRYHADHGHAQADLDDWYGAAATTLAAMGLRVALFTNGSPEDRDYLARMAPQWVRRARGPVTVTNPFADPTELAGFIGSCDLIVAHRMHACIAAHSFGIPTIGLRWDSKLDSFFALAGREAFIADTATLCAPQLAALARRALDEGVDRIALDRLIAATRADVAEMGRDLMAAA